MRWGQLAAVALLVACTMGVAASGAAAATPPATPHDMRALSDERTLSRWAYPVTLSVVYTRPTTSAQKITRLRWRTEDDFPELYLVLGDWVDDKGRRWTKIRLPMRPNGRTGWVPRTALGSYKRVNTHLVIDKAKLRATLYRSGKQIWSARVGIGAPGTPTPSGNFWIREKFPVRGSPMYGPYAIGTSAYAPFLTDWPGGGVVGLHGTNAPGLIPGRPSHGCIRLRNEDISKLYRLAPRGTPILIR